MFDLILPDLPTDSLVAVDTETSGLFVDDGARVSVVSIAWYPGGGTPGNPYFSMPKADQSHAAPPFQTLMPETAVFAFDQGMITPLGPKDLSGFTGKKRPQASLFDDEIEAAPNLDPHDYVTLMDWLSTMSLVFHHAKFDLHILQTGLRGYEHRADRLPDLSRCVAWDTNVANPVLWPWFPTGLKPTMERLFGDQETELQKALQQWLKKNGMRYDLAPWSLLGPYAADDASKTIRLYDVQQLVIDVGEAGDPEVVRTVCEREIDFGITLYRMESRGVGFDAEAALVEAEKLSSQIAKTQHQLRVEIHDRTGRYGSVDRVPAATEHLMRHLWYARPEDGGLGLMPAKMTEKGQASITLDVVRDLVESDTPYAQSYQTLNKLETALSMWYSTWPKLVGPPEPNWHGGVAPCWPRLRTSYQQARTHSDPKGGTISGRLAVQRVQLQAIPHDYQVPEGIVPIRRFFKADPGYQLWEMDLSQAEFRVAAGLARCQKMLDAFLDGDDVHSATCRLMFGVDEFDPEWDYLRTVAKRLNFGMLYGAGAPTIQAQIEQFTGKRPPLDSLQQWLATYRQTYPELGRLNRRTQRLVERNRELTLAGGRVRWFAPYEQEHKAFNQLVQGGVAEMMKVGMIDMEANYPGVLLLQIHDSCILEVPEGDEEIVAGCQKLLVAAFENEFQAPFKSDLKLWK